MRDHAGGLVHDHQVVVFEQPVELSLLWKNLRARLFIGQLHDHHVAQGRRVATRVTTLPLIETRPPSIHACTRVRVALVISVR